MFWGRTVRVTAVLAGAIGGVTSATWGVLMRQSRYAHQVIGEPEGPPPSADGRYYPPGWGATTRDMVGQVDVALENAPDLALVVVGGNDVTTRGSIRGSARLLGTQVGRLRAAGAGVVVGTCPDLLPIQPIHIPLRWVASAWSRLLARAQARAVHKEGGFAVPLGELVSPEFLTRPDELFSADHFHPNGAGYEIAKQALLGPLVSAAGADAQEEAAPAVTGPVRPLAHPEPATS